MAFDITVINQYFGPIIVSVIAAVVIIVVISEWRKVRQAQNNVALVERQVELKKIALVEKDLETKRLMENVIPLPKDQQEKLAEIRQGTSDIMHKVGYLHSEISERVALLEAKAEYGKLQKLMKDLEKKENDLDKKL